MPFDRGLLFQALLALWSITRSVTGVQGNLPETALAALGLWPAAFCPLVLIILAFAGQA